MKLLTMPELPEVETIARALRPHLIDRQILKTVVATNKLRNTLDIGLRKDILATKITGVTRRAKYIVVELENLAVIVLHLGMSGSCRIETSSTNSRKHDHVSWYLNNDKVWRFNDPRKFGIVKVDQIGQPGTFPLSLQHLPPEPLGRTFSSRYFFEVTHKRTKAIKSVLMDNTLIAGVGNIYACESLFLAEVNPKTPAGKLSIQRIEKLVKSIRTVLYGAIQAGGTTIADFKSVDGTEGEFVRELHVYGREGKGCIRCKDGIIKRTIVSGRSTYYCPLCQN